MEPPSQVTENMENVQWISRKPAIFLLGITERSGTSYLYHLFDLHPDCSVGQITEDFLLSHSNLLIEYATKSSNCWWEFVQPGNPKFNKALLHSIGNGLISFLWSTSRHPERERLFAKTPSVKNINNFFELFPKARLLILIRDGRDVTELFVRTSGMRYENAMQEWMEGARSIMNFDLGHKDFKNRYMLVKYLDVFTDTRNELARVFDFLGLSVQSYGFEKAENLSVLGLSVFRGNENELYLEASGENA